MEGEVIFSEGKDVYVWRHKSLNHVAWMQALGPDYKRMKNVGCVRKEMPKNNMCC